MNDINCPYCDSQIEINHDDGFGYQEGVKHQYECWKCNKTFVFETSILFHYDAEKADCLNNGDHNYKATHSYPKEYTEMECTMCGERRKPTELEMKEILSNG